MKILNREISVANRFIYYYANFVDRIYGFVTRKDGENVPEEHYVGRIDDLGPRRFRSRHQRGTGRSVRTAIQWQGDPQHPHLVDLGRRGYDPEEQEIVLFLYRKHLMLGSFLQRVRGKYYEILAEDGRRVAVRKAAFVYLTGVLDSEDGEVLGPYAGSVRELARHIELGEVWSLFKGEQDIVSPTEVASFYWADDVDSSRMVALQMHLEQDSPYFESCGPDACRVVASDEVAPRRRALEQKRNAGQDWREFIAWLGTDDDEPFAPEALTRKQRNWLEQIRQFALWGNESTTARRARQALSEALSVKTPSPQRTFDLLVRKAVWSEDENLDLLREDIALELPEDVVADADAIDLPSVLRESGRKPLRWRKAFTIRHDTDACPLAFTVRRRLLGGYELGVHIPDVASLVPPDSRLDDAASDRMGALCLPDREIRLLPARIVSDLASFQVGELRPALSLFWKLDRQLRPGPPRLALTALSLSEILEQDQVRELCSANGRKPGRSIRVLSQFSADLMAGRLDRGAPSDEQLPRLAVTYADGTAGIRREAADSPDRRITHELSILAATAIGEWCSSRKIPAIYRTQDSVTDQALVDRAPGPVAQRHERQRLSPPEGFSAEPGHHAEFGVQGLAAALDASRRYPDLVVQRQVRHVLQNGAPCYDEDALAPVRFRAQEELHQFDGMRYRRTRYFVLRHLSDRVGETYDATALHIRRDGVLVELSDLPLKTLVHPAFDVKVGELLHLRLAGVDLWRARAHFLVDP